MFGKRLGKRPENTTEIVSEENSSNLKRRGRPRTHTVRTPFIQELRELGKDPILIKRGKVGIKGNINNAGLCSEQKFAKKGIN